MYLEIENYNLTIENLKIKKRIQKMWESPIYKFRIPLVKTSEEKAIELTLDVTKSIPKGPASRVVAPDFKNCLTNIINNYKTKKILEFGAGNFKNIRYLLDKGLTVHAVDFEEVLEQNSTKEHYKKCEKHEERFGQIIFPTEFLNKTGQYDLIILSHVLTVMPVFLERLLALKLLYSKTKKGKYLIWHSQQESKLYRERRLSGKYDCGDGIWMGKNSAYRTFFKKMEPEEINELLILSGFLFVKKYKCGMGYLRLYEKQKYNILNDFITVEKVEEISRIDRSNFQSPRRTNIIVELDEIKEPIIPNPPEYSIQNIYLELLDSTSAGPGTSPHFYHRLSAIIFWFCLSDQISDMKIEREIDEGNGKIDVTFKNNNKEGFFKDIKDLADIISPMISVECKNYTKDIGNPEFAQLADRLNPTRGMIGFLLCRSIMDKKKMIHKLQKKVDHEKKYMIVLEDADLKNMLDLRFNSEIGAVNDYLRSKYEELIV